MAMTTLVPLGYIDKLCVAGTRAPWASGAPTWRLLVRGALDEASLRAATAWVLARYPLCASRVVSDGGSLERGRCFAWALDDAPDVDAAFGVEDLREVGAPARAAVEQRLADRFLDLAAGYPLRVTWVRLPPDGAVERSALYVQQHHALADGRAFLELLRDFVAALDGARRGVPATRPAPAPRQRELSVLAARGPALAAAFVRAVAQSLYAGARDALAPPTPLRCNVGDDYTGPNRTRSLSLPAARLERWRGARASHGLSTNDVLLGALAAALGRWSARHGHPPRRTRLFAIVDTRPRGAAFESFANHLSSYLVGAELRGAPKVLDVAASLGRQIAAQSRRHVAHEKLLVEAPLALASPIGWLRHIVFTRPRLVANHVFSNLIPLGTSERWRGEGFEVEALRVTTPCTPPQGMNTTVVRYGGELCFNFNHKGSVVDDALAGDFAATFEEALAEADAALARALPSAT